MPIEDVFSIKGRGTVVTGRIERGQVQGRRGSRDRRLQARPTKTVVTGVEMFRKILDEGVAGDNVGVLLRGVEKDDIERGQVLAKPGSIKPHTKFKAEVYVLTQGRGWPPHAVLHRLPPAVLLPHHRRHRHAQAAARASRWCMPGDNTTMTVELIDPGGDREGLCASPFVKAAAPSAPGRSRK